MGYLVEMFLEIGRLNLTSKRVLDVGAQDLRISSLDELDSLNEFIGKSGSTNLMAFDTFPQIVTAKNIYERAGWSYTNIDVDERPGTLRVDLARFEIPKTSKKFDLVVNVGTSEHLANPIAAFALMHELCAEGGVIYNDVPLFGFGNHGLINPTPKFWHALIWMNGYDPLKLTVRAFDESSVDKGNFYHDYLSYMSGLSEIQNISHIIRVVLRKTSPTIFVVPYDAVMPESEGHSLAQLLAGSYRPFLATGAYTESEVVHSINNFLRMNAHSYQITKLADLNSSAPTPFSVLKNKSLFTRLKFSIKNFLIKKHLAN